MDTSPWRRITVEEAKGKIGAPLPGRISMFAWLAYLAAFVNTNAWLPVWPAYVIGIAMGFVAWLRFKPAFPTQRSYMANMGTYATVWIWWILGPVAPSPSTEHNVARATAVAVVALIVGVARHAL